MTIIPNFAVFEGGDGSGTSTQLELLRKRFPPHRSPEAAPPLPPLYATFEPTGGPIGGLIREALRGTLSLRPETLARLFAADRNEHLHGKDGIAERCARGELAVSDRYVLSSLVYQGLDCGEALPARLNEDFPAPELLLFFDLDPETAWKRLEARPLKDSYEHRGFQILVYRRYRDLLPRWAGEGVRVERIDASRTPSEVAGEVWRALKKMPILGGVENGNGT